MANSESLDPKGQRRLPSVADLLETPPLKGLVSRVNRTSVVIGARSFLSDIRTQVRHRPHPLPVPPISELAARIADHVRSGDGPSPRPAINATGILLHSGLGRAVLPERAIEYVAAVGRDSVIADKDVEPGGCSRPSAAVGDLLCRLTGAEAALVVNSNAGAVYLALAALAQGREVVVSRGELLQIGTTFRVPDVIAASGARLREIGTVNHTQARDYRDALGAETAAILRVHGTSCRVAGCADRPSLAELVELAKVHSLPVIDDIGSCTLIDLARFGLHGQPTAAESLGQGADLVLFSGDKLLGGPQCGIILGNKTLVDRLAEHPLARGMQVDKLRLAALTATLELLRSEELALREVPLLQLLATPQRNLRQRAERLAEQIAGATLASVEVCPSEAYLSEASLAHERVPSWCVALEPQGMTVDQLAARLRRGTPAVVGRIDDGRLRLDLRTVFPRQDSEIVAAASRS